jgi:hypothetical protein
MKTVPIVELNGARESPSGVDKLPMAVMIGEGNGIESGWMNLGRSKARGGAMVEKYLLPDDNLSS